MRNLRALAVVSMLLLSAPLAHAQAIFAGTWRPDPQRPEPGEPPDVIELANGSYECRSCTPPYKVKADGTDQPIRNNPRFDMLNISIADARTLLKTVKKGSETLVRSRTVVSQDGNTKTEVQTLIAMPPHPVDMAVKSKRVSAGPPGSHSVSGQWQFIEADLVNHDEDTTYKVGSGIVTMTDRLGRSFKAKLDGPDAPYNGDPRYTSVSLKLLNDRTIEETDKNGAQKVLVTRWYVDPDGKTMHARFDNTRGSVQEQTGHKLP